MGTETFSDFLAMLDRAGELTRVKTRVSPILEIAAICDRVCKTPAPHGHQELDKSLAASLGGRQHTFPCSIRLQYSSLNPAISFERPISASSHSLQRRRPAFAHTISVGAPHVPPTLPRLSLHFEADTSSTHLVVVLRGHTKGPARLVIHSNIYQ